MRLHLAPLSLLWIATATSAAVDWSSLKSLISGSLILPSDSGYSDASHQWNADYDSIHPAAVAFCLNEKDVQSAVKFTAFKSPFDLGVILSGGFSVCDQCLVIDTSKLNHLVHDTRSNVVRAGVDLETLIRTGGEFNATVSVGFGPTVH